MIRSLMDDENNKPFLKSAYEMTPVDSLIDNWGIRLPNVESSVFGGDSNSTIWAVKTYDLQGNRQLVVYFGVEGGTFDPDNGIYKGEVTFYCLGAVDLYTHEPESIHSTKLTGDPSTDRMRDARYAIDYDNGVFRRANNTRTSLLLPNSLEPLALQYGGSPVPVLQEKYPRVAELLQSFPVIPLDSGHTFSFSCPGLNNIDSDTLKELRTLLRPFLQGELFPILTLMEDLNGNSHLFLQFANVYSVYKLDSEGKWDRLISKCGGCYGLPYVQAEHLKTTPSHVLMVPQIDWDSLVYPNDARFFIRKVNSEKPKDYRMTLDESGFKETSTWIDLTLAEGKAFPDHIEFTSRSHYLRKFSWLLERFASVVEPLKSGREFSIEVHGERGNRGVVVCYGPPSNRKQEIVFYARSSDANTVAPYVPLPDSVQG